VKSKHIATAVLAGIATHAVADARLSGDGLSQAVAGAIVEIDTPLGERIPVHYGRQGNLNGHARSMARYLGSASDTGRWWIEADQLCHQWTKWFSGQKQCLRITRRGSTLQWQQADGSTSGTATIVSRDGLGSGTASAPAPAATTASSTTKDIAGVPAQSRPVEPRFTREQKATEMAPEPAEPPVRSRPAVAAVARVTAASVAVPVATPVPVIAKAAAAGARADKVRPSQPASRSDPASDGLTWRVVSVEPDDVLNVREGPSAEHPAVGALAPAAGGVTLSGACRGSWCPITHVGLSGWVNRRFLESDGRASAAPAAALSSVAFPALRDGRDAPRSCLTRDAPRSCLTREARALLERIETRFGPVQVISTCRPGARIAGTGRPSRHASGNAVDFNAGPRKAEIVAWLVANHSAGGTMTYAGMDHVHVDIGPHFVALDSSSRSGRRWRSAAWQ
jgi:hypothetical protein